jgi:hypothetical protein
VSAPPLSSSKLSRSAATITNPLQQHQTIARDGGYAVITFKIVI